jgi:hypothetical protein
VRRAIEQKFEGNVAVLASGSLSHRFAQNGVSEAFLHKVWDPFLESVDHHVVDCGRRRLEDLLRHVAGVRGQVPRRRDDARHGDAARRARRRGVPGQGRSRHAVLRFVRHRPDQCRFPGSIEIIDARCHRIDPETKRPRKVMDTISDNAANVGIILGGRPIKPLEQDLRWAAALLYKNGVIEETGVAAGVLNHPANGIVWLAKKFAPHGVALEPGQIILAGSFTRPVKVVAGDTIHADYGPLGNITAHFV